MGSSKIGITFQRCIPDSNSAGRRSYTSLTCFRLYRNPNYPQLYGLYPLIKAQLLLICRSLGLQVGLAVGFALFGVEAFGAATQRAARLGSPMTPWAAQTNEGMMQRLQLSGA